MNQPAKTCAVTGKEVAAESCVPCAALRPLLFEFIRKRFPAITDSDCIAADQLIELKAAFIEAALSEEIGEISDLERDVIESLKQHEILSTSPDAEDSAPRNLGERLADDIAAFGGSWGFILGFGALLLLWVLFNTIVWAVHPPDPYPFIFLNLLLSCLAAIQAPVIMMSQNRQEARDRHRAEQDYKINLKAELEIRHLHEKLDHLLRHQNQRMLEIQEIQVDLLRQLVIASRKTGQSDGPRS